MKRSLALLTAAVVGLTFGTVSSGEVNTAPKLQQQGPSPMIVALSKEQEKKREKKERKRERKERKREKKAKIKEKERRLKEKERKLDRS